MESQCSDGGLPKVRKERLLEQVRKKSESPNPSSKRVMCIILIRSTVGSESRGVSSGPRTQDFGLHVTTVQRRLSWRGGTGLGHGYGHDGPFCRRTAVRRFDGLDERCPRQSRYVEVEWRCLGKGGVPTLRGPLAHALLFSSSCLASASRAGGVLGRALRRGAGGDLHDHPEQGQRASLSGG